MVVGSFAFKELLNLIILYQMMYITDWSKYSLGCMNNYYFNQNIKITTFFPSCKVCPSDSAMNKN